MTPIEEWNEFFQKNFPEGAIITFLRGSEEAAEFDKSPQCLTDRVITIAVNGDNPNITFTDFGTNRNYILDIDKIEERPFGYLMRTTETKQPDILISRDLSDDMKSYLKED